ncbi:hypothetical protein DRP07_06545 [Archaeoglobales archaeon]|nr:MAG: hypothetical protein DRP07_06545 [Archaeoglobales archaeon]
MEFNSKIEYTPADYVVHMEMGDFGLRISTRQGIANATTSIHNLNETFDCSGETTSLTPLTLTYDRTQNKLEIG